MSRNGSQASITNVAPDAGSANNSSEIPSAEIGTLGGPAGASDAASSSPVVQAAATQEHGGRDGPEPTRYGDWEKGGRCIDF
jgi:hypothetical protein